MPQYRVAVDTGGTFTDFVVLREDTRVASGHVSEAAARHYGVVTSRGENGTVVLDRPATEKLRWRGSSTRQSGTTRCRPSHRKWSPVQDMAASRWSRPSAAWTFFKNLVGRGGRPEHIADGVLFPASGESSFIDATDLVVDGGVLHGPMG